MASIPLLALQARSPDLAAVQQRVQAAQSGNLQQNLLNLQLAGAQTTATTAAKVKQLMPDALYGNKEAIRQIAALDPAMASQLETARQDKLVKDAKVMSQLLGNIAALPAEQRSTAMPQIKAQAANLGLDMSDWPDKWDENLYDLVLAQAGEEPETETLELTPELQARYGGRRFVTVPKSAARALTSQGAVPTTKATAQPAAFGGTGFKNQAADALLALGQKIQAGETLTPAEQAKYNLSYAILSQPTYRTDELGRTIEVPPMNLTSFPSPSGQAQDQGTPTSARRLTGPKPLQKADRTDLINAREASKDLVIAREILFDNLDDNNRLTDKSGINTIDLVAGHANLAKTEGRRARQAMRRSVEIILRARTGAAAPDTEVDNYMDLYFPSLYDNDAAARDKMQRLQGFFDSVISYVEAGREGDAPLGYEGETQNSIRYTATSVPAAQSQTGQPVPAAQQQPSAINHAVGTIIQDASGKTFRRVTFSSDPNAGWEEVVQ
tara:strand:+ start:9170 stop:10660 length:1491 start_codon:yes stop_codon:yes gene_type:complete